MIVILFSKAWNHSPIKIISWKQAAGCLICTWLIAGTEIFSQILLIFCFCFPLNETLHSHRLAPADWNKCLVHCLVIWDYSILCKSLVDLFLVAVDKWVWYYSTTPCAFSAFSTAVRIHMMNDQSDVNAPDKMCFIIVLYFWGLLVIEKHLIAEAYV